MLKHEDIISKMTTQEKLAIITNYSNLDTENLQDEYKYLSQKIALRGLHFNGSVLPNIGTIASSFNDDLMYKYSSFLGSTAYKSNYKFMISPSLNVFNRKNLVSKEPYLNTVALNSFIKGLNDNSVIPLLNYYDNDTNIKTDDFIHMNEYLQCLFNIKNNELPFMFFDNKTNKYKSNKISEIISKIGYSRLLMNNIFYEEQTSNIVSLNKGNISSIYFTEKEIDETLDNFLDYLLKDDHNEDLGFEYDKLVNELVIESTCILKNDNLLPLKGFNNVAFFTNSNITDVDFSDLKDDMKVSVYDKLPNADHKNAYSLLILVIDNSEDVEHLYRELHKLHNAHDRNIKILVVLSTNDVVNTQFDQYVDGLIKTVNLNKNNIKTFMDILLGNKCPCGKLNISYPNDNYEFLGNELLTEEHTKYPFGFSLNYGKLTYSNFEYDKNKISFTIKNENKTCVSDVIQIYMENQRWLGEKHLIYYKKVYLKPSYSQKIEIVLTRDMFMRFNMNSNTYRLKKGLYRIYVNNSLINCLKDYLVIFDISKDTLIGKKFKNSALVALEPRYKGREIQPKNKKYFVYGNLTIALIACLSYFLTNSFISFVVGGIFALLAIMSQSYRIKPKVTKKFDLDKEYTADDVIQFEEFYQDDYVQNDYVYDRSEIFKEERKKENINDSEENLFYIKEEKDLATLFKDQFNYFLSNGITIEHSEYYNLCGAISSSRVIYIKTNNAVQLKDAVRTANRFFNNVDFNCYDLKDTIKVAKANPHKIFFVYLSEVNSNMRNINNDCKFDTMVFKVNIDGEEIELTKNIWFILNYDSLKIKYFDFNALVTSITFLNIQEVKYEKKLYQVYFDTFNEYVNALPDLYTVDESIYKKFDDLAIQFKSLADEKYFNKLVTHMEKFAAINMSLRIDSNLVLDNIFSYKLIYYIFRHNINHLNKSLTKDYISTVLIETFGEENLTKTLEIIDNEFEDLTNA